MKTSLLLFLAPLLSLGTATAQDSRGAIIGRVTDPSGARVPGARISAVNVATNTTAGSVTNQDATTRPNICSPASTASASSPRASRGTCERASSSASATEAGSFVGFEDPDGNQLYLAQLNRQHVDQGQGEYQHA